MADNESKNNYWVLELSRYDKIEEVYIAYTQMGVQGIAFRYVDATGTKQFKNFGLMHFNFAMKLKPNEYITKLSSIIVTEPQKAIALLRIHTNLLPAGKSGRDDLLNQKEKEHPKWLEKSIPVQTYEDIIVRIYGSPSSNELKKGETFLLTNIGVIVQKLKFKETKHLEMWDENVMPPQLSSKHQKWSFEFDRYEYIKEISVDHNDTEVIRIGFMKVDAFGAPTPIQWFGGKGEKSENTYKITLKPNENIVQMSGTWSYNNENEIVITSLKIHTNVWRSGYKLYGNNSPPNENSKYFSILVPTSGVISEIHGTHNNTNMHISSIGIGVKEPEYKREDYLMGVDTIKEEKHDEGDDAKKEEPHEGDDAKKEESHEGGDAKKEEQREGDDAKKEEHREGDDAKKEENREGDDAKKEEQCEGDDAKKEEHREGDNAKKEENREGDNAKKEESHEGDHAKEEHHEGDGAKKEEEHHE